MFYFKVTVRRKRVADDQPSLTHYYRECTRIRDIGDIVVGYYLTDEVKSVTVKRISQVAWSRICVPDRPAR